MKNMAIARRYAKALLIIAKEDGKADDYRKELNGFTDLISSQKELENAINNPIYNTDDRKKVLKTVVAKTDVSRVMASFLSLLFEKGRFGFLDNINEFYNNLADDLNGITRANLISATKLSSEATDKIKDALSRKTGKKVILDIEQDPGLIGGIITKMGDLVLDGSIKTQLHNMRESLKRGENI